MYQDTRNEDFHLAVAMLLEEHDAIHPWFEDGEETLDTKRLKFLRCGDGKPLVYDNSPVRGALWVREEDFHEEYAFENQLNINSIMDDRSHMMPNIHILKLPAMQTGGLMCYDGRNVWAAVKLLQDLAGQPDTQPW